MGLAMLLMTSTYLVVGDAQADGVGHAFDAAAEAHGVVVAVVARLAGKVRAAALTVASAHATTSCVDVTPRKC